MYVGGIQLQKITLLRCGSSASKTTPRVADANVADVPKPVAIPQEIERAAEAAVASGPRRHAELRPVASPVVDERYAVRGFYFGLEPPDYEDKLYVSWGDPRHFGLMIEFNF